MAAKRYQSKVLQIEAIQACENTPFAEIETFMKEEEPAFSLLHDEDVHIVGVLITTSGGAMMRARIGDWIIKTPRGEFYLMKDENFQDTYEEIEQIREEDKCWHCGAIIEPGLIDLGAIACANCRSGR